MMSNDRLAALAEFCGLKVYGENENWSGWWVHEKDLLAKYPSDRGIFYNSWQPRTNPAHGWLILKALIYKLGHFYIDCDCRADGEIAATLVIGEDSPDAEDITGQFWDAVCDAAEEVMKEAK